MLTSTGLDIAIPAAEHAAFSGNDRTGPRQDFMPDTEVGYAENSGTQPLGENRPGASVSWLLLHARQHMQGRV